MALSFLYVLCVRVTQLVRLSWRGQDELAIEVVMLRHAVAVLRCCMWTGHCLRDWLACSPDTVVDGSSSCRPPCGTGTEISSADAGPICNATRGSRSPGALSLAWSGKPSKRGCTEPCVSGHRATGPTR
ncbi:MAG: hypothetical protein ACYDGN_15680 [Acidimicrobiales bacterium]